MSFQRTFTLIPPVATTRGDSLDRRVPAQHFRPMTSKQAQKAYKSSTKTPTVSRAEQLRRDRAEQERIRKEFEKEKATAKARLARERKKEKESAERELKKRKRMPLVSVRPSQDTIARFVRGNGSGKKRNCAGGAMENMSGSGARQEVSGRDSCDEKVKSETRAALSSGVSGTRELALIAEEADPAANADEEEEEEDIESGLEELLDAISKDQCGVNHQKSNDDDIFETGSPPGPTRRGHMEEEEEEEAVMIPPSKLPSLLPNSRPPHVSQALPQEKSSKPAPLSIPAPPSPPSPRPPSPPMSTQAILGNLEDFFPSSSQQARELQDDTFSEPHPSPCENMTPKPSSYDSKAPTSTPAPPPRRRFFTPSGTSELVSLAIQRSRRSAALHEIQQQRMQLSQNDVPVNATRAAPPNPPEPSPTTAHKTRCRGPCETKPPPTTTGISTEKENIPPQTARPRFTASQESEYGGEWVDDLALELII
ncbi:hypothetical protein E4U21_006719 [Claviceps maximensis]|nr:hypothetical protein E4U21_006719 [Claviceps maximensis]